MLPPEEAILSVLKWRAQNMNPVYRFFPVLNRLLSLVEGRVNGLGGNSAGIPPTLGGVPSSSTCPCWKKHARHCPCKGHHSHQHDGGKGGKDGDGECVGRVSCVFYDDCGKFEGFCIREEGKGEVEKRFTAGKSGFDELVRRAWEERWCVEVLVEEERHGEVEVAKGIILRRAV